MDLEWQLDNPSITLKKYSEDVLIYKNKKETDEIYRTELSDKKNNLRIKQKELNDLTTKLNSMGTYVQVDINSMIQNTHQNCTKKIENEKIILEEKKRKLLEKKSSDIVLNDNWLEKRIKDLVGDSDDLEHVLTELEKKALDFEINRRKFINESNANINRYQDAISEENLDCERFVCDCKEEQDSIFKSYEPKVTEYECIIDSINKKYQPDIKNYQNIITEKTEVRDDEIEQLQSDKDREIKLANNEISGYQNDYRLTEKQFAEQISMAKMQGKPTTRIENTKVSRLNGINDQIQKVKNRTNKRTASIDIKIEAAYNKHDKQIEKVEAQLESVIKDRDEDLYSPTQEYNSLVQDRDSRISDIQLEIDNREKRRSNSVDLFNTNISKERIGQKKNNDDIDENIVQYVMSGDNCFFVVLNEAYAPFEAMHNRVEHWKKLLAFIKKKNTSNEFIKESVKQKSALVLKKYGELKNDVNEANEFNDTVSFVAKNNDLLSIIGISLSIIGLAIFVIVFLILYISGGKMGLLLTAIGLALLIYTVVKSKQEFSKICKFISLATDYKEFSSIATHSTQVTKERELEKMRNLGRTLYDVHYGKIEAQKLHDDKRADIESDYKRDLELLQEQFDNVKEQAERERDAEIRKIQDDAQDGEEKFYSEKEELQSLSEELTSKVERLNGKVNEIKQKIDDASDFFDSFEYNYTQLIRKLEDSNWITSMEYTHGKLQNELFVIPENGYEDEYGHKNIYKINHNKKALVITYDICDLDQNEGSQVEKVGKIIQSLLEELMYSVYRMNSRESYVQYIVDEVVCTNSFKSTTYKNAFNIRAIVGKVEDIRGYLKNFSLQRERLSAKGTQIDDVNDNKFKIQDRPEIYNLLYIIYKPDERKNKLDEEIRTLIPDCDKYGFLPIFICEKETWNRELQEKESMYKDIKNLVNNAIITYDGIKYFENV